MCGYFSYVGFWFHCSLNPITAYNGGAGSVLRVFSSDKVQAANIINSMAPGDVYQTLTTRHPSAESRRYLYKVNTAQKSYRRK
ncbi:murein transglycosylase C [Klebsiella quasipneumoniae]|nr:murein transglycosylase C [Klebsiella quasipneumoniae]SBZ98892.1 murein transglycosylase C [Klebsiella quasipneumoniae]